MLSLIATDLDGTFLTDGAAISPENLAAVQKAADYGIPFMFATGRPVRWLDFLRETTGHPHAISVNGAVVVDLATGEIEASWPVDMNVITDVVADVCAEEPETIIGLEHSTEMTVERPYFTKETTAITRLDNRNEVLASTKPVYKLILEHPRMGTEAFYECVAPVVGERLSTTFSWIHPERGFLELSAPEVSKRSALEWFCQQHGINPAEAVAFGDMPNDLEMLQWVGRGYAMPGCHASLLSAGIPQLDGDQRTAFGRQVLSLLSET